MGKKNFKLTIGAITELIADKLQRISFFLDVEKLQRTTSPLLLEVGVAAAAEPLQLAQGKMNSCYARHRNSWLNECILPITSFNTTRSALKRHQQQQQQQFNKPT